MNCQVPKCKGKCEYGSVGSEVSRCRLHAQPKDTKYPFESCIYQACLKSAVYS